MGELLNDGLGILGLVPRFDVEKRVQDRLCRTEPLGVIRAEGVHNHCQQGEEVLFVIFIHGLINLLLIKGRLLMNDDLLIGK